MKMKNNQKIPVSILADREVFEYLKEKGDERKTRTEAYCDLLDKSLAGFVSPFLRKKAYVLQPNQCHLTVSDLASEWHWHRATVRSFLSAMEAFGLLTRIQLPKSVVITMTVQSGQAAQPRNAQEQPDFARQLREVLSDWVIGKTTAAETGVICGQLVSLAKTEIADRDTGLCLDTHSNTTSAHSGTLVTEHRETALCCIAHAALQKILHKSRFDDSSPLVDFFRFDLGEEWAAFIESAKDLAGLGIELLVIEIVLAQDLACGVLTFEMDDQTGQRLSADVFEGQANRNFAGDVTFQQFYANKLDRAAGRIIVGAGLRHQGKILIHGSHLLFTVARRAGP